MVDTSAYINLNGILVNPEVLKGKQSTIARMANLHVSTVNNVLSRRRKSFLPRTINLVRDAVIKLLSDAIINPNIENDTLGKKFF